MVVSLFLLLATIFLCKQAKLIYRMNFPHPFDCSNAKVNCMNNEYDKLSSLWFSVISLQKSLAGNSLFKVHQNKQFYGRFCKPPLLANQTRAERKVLDCYFVCNVIKSSIYSSLTTESCLRSGKLNGKWIKSVVAALQQHGKRS